MPNRTDLVVHYLGCFKAGLVATPPNYRYTFREIDHALEVSGADALLAHVERSEERGRERPRGRPALRAHRLRRRNRRTRGELAAQLSQAVRKRAAGVRSLAGSVDPGGDLLYFG